ncbi:MAG: hypothetical protein WKF88_10190 [Ferruginibacter sp.]
MDQAKIIANLKSENELLQLQLEDLIDTLKKREEEINLLGDATESAASLYSRIDNTLTEIDQLIYNNELAGQKTVAAEAQSEELELTLIREIRERQKAQTAGLKTDALRTELDIISGELEETLPVYQQLQTATAELSELNSRLSMLESENASLKTELEEWKALVTVMKKQKIS